MNRMAAILVAPLAVAVGCTAPEPPPTTEVVTAPALDLTGYALVDLSHAFDARTIYWPTSPTAFSLDTLSHGISEGGYFYSSYSIATPEHGGTHLDAPVHFAEGAAATDAVPLERLVALAVVIDVSEQAATNPDYLLTPDDVEAFEAENGRIPAGSIVLLRTGWSERWPDRLAYLGDDTPNDASNLHFPSYGEAAARLLVEERQVGSLGADVASIDGGISTDFLVHRLAGAAGVPGFENLTDLDRLPPTGAIVIALPMKIGGGSGGPLRAIALVPVG
jgi:kynurenine formamidase